MKVIFISGAYRAPNTLEIEHNIRHAEAAAIELWKQGWAAYCPHKNTAHFDGICSDETWLEGNLEILSRCDAIYMLREWENSQGARAELHLAKEHNLEILFEK